MTASVDSPYIEKVRKMLDLAERASTEAEAEVARGKAMEFMTRHQITDAMLGDRGEVKDEIGQITLDFFGIFGKSERMIGYLTAEAMGCQCVIGERNYTKPKKVYTTVTGWRSDLTRLEVLVASLQMQCKSALKKWEREQKNTGWADLPGFERFKDRRQFVESFAYAAARRLRTATEAAIKEAAAERVAESHGTENETEALKGVALALRDRKESVKDWYDKHYGTGLRSVAQRHHGGSYGASSAGAAAGSRADIGQARVGGGRRAIGR